MAYLPGKFARVNLGTTAIQGAYRWAPGFKRERLDVTNFESVVSASGNNVFSDGQTGVLDTTFSIEMWMTDVNVNLFFPDATLQIDLLFRKNNPLGYKGLVADVLDFSTSVEVRGMPRGTASLQTSGLVPSAA